MRLDETPLLDDSRIEALVAFSEGRANGSADPDDSLEPLRDCLRLIQEIWPRPEAGPARVGRYEIVRELGRGGHGVVYLARDSKLGREVALKLPQPSALATPSLRERFIREARATSRLEHPNLVPVFDVGGDDLCLYSVSAYCDGPNLAVWLRERTEPVPINRAVRWIAELARGMQHAHERGVLHRDLKPSNILMSAAPAGGEVVPRICDFGLARQLDDIGGDRTRTGILVGSPPYMAPEQVAARPSEVGPAADIHALGAILYEVLTGRPPFQGETVIETIEQVRDADPPAPRQLRPGLPRDVETILSCCLAKRPESRYRSAAALAEDCERFLDGRPIQARPTPVWKRALKWARRRPALAALTAVSLLAATALFCGLIAIEAMLQRHNATLRRAVERAEHGEWLADRRLAESRIRLAQQALNDRQFDQARGLLDLAGAALGPPGRRGFAWSYLDQACRAVYTPLEGHESTVLCVKATADGTTLVSADRSGEVRLWDMATGQPRGRLQGLTGSIHQMAIDPESRLLATGPFQDGEQAVELWDLASLRRCASIGHLAGGTLGMGFVAEQQVLFTLHAVRASSPDRACFWDISDPDRMVRLPLTADEGIARYALNQPAVQHIADLLDGVPSASRPVPCTTSSIAFTRDGGLVVQGHDDGLIEVRRVEDGFVLARCDTMARVVKLSVPGDGHSVFRPGDRERIDRLAAAGRILLGNEPNAILARSRNGRTLVLSHGHELLPPVLLDPRDGREIEAFPSRVKSDVCSVACSPDGATAALGFLDRGLWLWHLRSRSSLILKGHAPAEAWSVAFAPDRRMLASGGDEDHLIRLWDPDTGTALGTLAGHQSLVSALAYSPDGSLLASASFDETIRLWGASSRRLVGTLKGAEGKLRTLAFAPDGRRIAAAGAEHRVRLWDVLEQRPDGPPLEGLADECSALVFTRDGRGVVAGDWQGTLCFWDMTARSSTVHRMGSGVDSLAVTPDGTTLAIGLTDGRIVLWDLKEQRARTTLLGHSRGLRGLAVHPDGATLASAGRDGTARLWSLATGQEVLCIKGPGSEIHALAFSADGRTLATALHDGTIPLYRAP